MQHKPRSTTAYAPDEAGVCMIWGWRGAVGSRNHGLGAVAAIHLAVGRHAMAVAVEHPGTWAKERVQESESKLHTPWGVSQVMIQSGNVTQHCKGCLRLSKS